MGFYFMLRINEQDFYYQVTVLMRLLDRDGVDTEHKALLNKATELYRYPRREQRRIVRSVRRLWVELAMNPKLNETLPELLARKARDHKRYGVE